MPKRLTYEFVKEQFEKEGYELLSRKYINAHDKLKYQCQRGHIHSISFTKWQSGRRCPYCSGKSKKTINFIKQRFEDEGYELLSKSYENNRSKLMYKCPNGHIHTISWCGWKKGDRCPYCSGLIRKKFNDIKDSFENEGYILLSGQYINAHSKLKCECSQGHIYEVTWNNWHNNRRCPICDGIFFSKKFSGKNSWHWKNYSDEDLNNLYIYKQDVCRLTNINYINHRLLINPSSLPRRRNGYHLDHIYSIMEGFRNNVYPAIIAHPANLQMLLYRDNIIKKDISLLSLDELYNKINEWEKTYGI